MQKDICKKYGLPVLPPDEMVAIAIATLGKSPIYGTRISLPEGVMSVGLFTAENIRTLMIFIKRFILSISVKCCHRC